MSNLPVAKEKMDTFRSLIEARRSAIQAMLPKHLSAERICRVAVMAASRNPLLLECDQASVVRAVMTASQLGLEPGSPIGGAHLVPFRNGRTGKHEATLIIDYRGLIDLARRSGNIVSIEAHVVHKADRFVCQFGLGAKLEHEPEWTAEDPGPMVAVYAVAKLKDGGEQAEVMTRAQVDAIRKRSRAGDSGPWVTDYDEMARKTVVKRLCKYLPMSVELRSAFEAEEADEYGADAITVEVEGQPVPPAASLAEKVRRGRSTKAIESIEVEPQPEQTADALDAQVKATEVQA